LSTAASGAAARAAKSGSVSIQRAKYGSTVFTWVCCSMNSLTTVR